MIKGKREGVRVQKPDADSMKEYLGADWYGGLSDNDRTAIQEKIKASITADMLADVAEAAGDCAVAILEDGIAKRSFIRGVQHVFETIIPAEMFAYLSETSPPQLHIYFSPEDEETPPNHILQVGPLFDDYLDGMIGKPRVDLVECDEASEREAVAFAEFTADIAQKAQARADLWREANKKARGANA